MRILFHNYSNELTTEPLYLSNAMRQCGLDVTLWVDPSISAYDAFDMNKPDVFITHAYSVTPDIFKYLGESKKIDLVLNVTGLSDVQVSDIEKYCDHEGVKCPFMFTNHFSLKGRNKTPDIKTKFHRVYPAFDLFLSNPIDKPKIISEGVISQHNDEQLQSVIKDKEVYHLIQVTNGEREDGFDLRTNATSLKGLYPVYNKLTVVGDANFCSSQLFFDLNYNTHNISISCHDETAFFDFLSEAFENIDTGEDIKLQVREQIKNRHTPFHRAATLCKHLKAKDEMAKVERAKSQLSELLKGQ